ncbi:MAG TPA: hypothetical protein VHB21_21510, partial [Minicystis sp.]|nr:hypothetical protein [Minicystis sp.]
IQGNTLRGAACLAPDDVWFVGELGALLHYDGTQWSQGPQLTGATITGISAVAPDEIFAVTNRGDVLHDHAGVWTSERPFAIAYAAVWATAPDDVWASGSHALAHYDGSTWTKTPVAQPYPAHVRAFGPDDVYLNNPTFDANDHGLIHYDGTTFTRVMTPVQPVSAIFATSPTDIWVAGVGVAHYDGTTWTPFDVTYQPGASGRPVDMWGSSTDDVWVGGEYGGLLHSNGTQWAQLPQFSPVDPMGGCGLAPNAMWVVGDNGMSFWNGQEFTPGFTANSDVRALWFADESDIQAADEFERVHYDGTAWTRTATWDEVGATDASGTSSSDVWVVGYAAGGERARIDHWDGNQWSKVVSTFPQSADLHSVWTPAPNDVWFAGEHILGHYDGTSWVNDPIAVAGTFTGVHGTSSVDVWAVAATDVYHRNAQGWKLATSLPVPVNAVWAAAAGDVWAVGDQLFHFDGVSWTSVTTAPATLFDVWGSGPADVYAVGAAGTILHYDGSSWTQMASGTNRDFFTVWGNGPNHVFVGGAHGAILRHDG